MRPQITCLPYLILVAVVMSIYSVFLVHLTKSLGPSPSPKTYPGGDPGREGTIPCHCTSESVEGVMANRQVVMLLTSPYRYFNSNHWFHIGEYYVSRHAEVESRLPKNATIYIVAPHELFVANLIPMTFFLLLLAFTDGTTRTAEVLPRSALMHQAMKNRVRALDTTDVESYVYDSSLPAFQRTRKYKSGERNPLLRSRGLLRLDGEGGGEDFRETHDGGVRGSISIGGLETEHQAVMDVVVSGSPAAFRIAPKITTAPREAARVLATRGVGQAEEEDPSPALQEAVTGVRGRRLKQDSGAVFLPFPTPAPETRPCACAHYIGEVGPAPKERGYWFQRERVDDVRARIDALCGDIYRRWRHGYSPETEGEDQGPGVAANSSMGEDFWGRVGGSTRKRLVIYQRDKDRQLLAMEGVMSVLGELLGSEWELVPIVHDNSLEPCWLYSQLMDADMLLTPHGFQSMLLLFLPPGATILEVFPYKYWKDGYAPLAQEWGVRHEYIMSRPVSWVKRLGLFFVPLDRCMKSISCRKWSRGADVLLEKHHLRKIAKAAKEASKRKGGYLVPPAPVAPGSSARRR
ncbi:unnamed protein product [Ascophyllum nodosum]